MRRTTHASHPLTCLVITLLCAVGCSGESTTSGGNDAWDGVYTKQGLELVLAKSSREYLGQLEIDGESLIATAQLVDGVIEGTFVSGGETFGFSMKRAGDAYLLTSGGVEHRLTRVPPDVPVTSNPLAKLATSGLVPEVSALPVAPVTRPSSIEEGAIEILAAESLDLVVNYGVSLLGEKNFDGAIYAFDYVLRRDSKNTYGWYNLACAQSLQGRDQEALAALAKSIECGYDEFDHMQQDPDLDALRSLPAYRTLVAGRGAAAPAESSAESSAGEEPARVDAAAGSIVAELVGGFRKTSIRGSGGMSFVTDRYLWLHANGQCEDGSKTAGGDAGSSFRSGDGSSGSTGTWSGTADTLSLRWNDGSVEDYTWFWYDNGVSAVQLVLSSGGTNYRYTQFE